MILSLLIIGMGLVWLGHETQWLSIRLPYGKISVKENNAAVSGVLALPCPTMPLLLSSPITNTVFNTEAWINSLPENK